MEKIKVSSFAEFTKENAYKVTADGKFEKQAWSYYKDVYPEKYDMVTGEKALDSFVWIIKHDDVKVAILSDKITEDQVKKILEGLK